MSPVFVSARGGTLVTCRVVPSAPKSGIAEITSEAVRVRVAAPPVEGKANRALEVFLARLLKVPKSAVAVVKGETGKLKKVLVAGLSPAEVEVKIRSVE